MTDPVTAGIVVGAMALILLSAAWHKFSEPNAFLAALAGYRLVPTPLLGAMQRAIPVIEALLGASLLVPLSRHAALYGAAGLVALYGLAMAINLLRGRSYIDCGCGGSGQPLSWGLVVRNGLIAAAAVAATGTASDRAFDWLDGVTLIFGVLAFYIAYLMADELLRQASRMARTRSQETHEGEPAA